MASRSPGTSSQTSLRVRAIAQLTGREAPLSNRVSDGASAALRVLYDLAISPDTAADALALLHELQVHQVELELQGEELRQSRNDLESALARQVQIYDCLPASVFTIDPDTRLHEVNLTGAQRLMADREMLLGQRLDAFLAPTSAHALHALLERIDQGTEQASCELTLKAGQEDAPGRPATVLATVNIDPVGLRYLLVFTDLPRSAD
ncbi:PAS domain-containing protein [Aquabacterium sp.]|uniref:PAS domain-containing protein n=1 Tax=Aquabacterium sp. TaxID=1872578 RepID=UPI002E34E4B1|nr:PAS domain-containing protein [Aquabacterium sp.]HEX5311964.1 PAS domain-containing protein [Aquabacterium sp.]